MVPGFVLMVPDGSWWCSMVPDGAWWCLFAWFQSSKKCQMYTMSDVQLRNEFLTKFRFYTSRMNEFCLHCHWLYFFPFILSFGQCVMSVRHLFIKMLGIESIHSKVAINHSALFTASDNFRIIMNNLRQKKGKTSVLWFFLARMLLEIGLLFSKSNSPISWFTK